MNSIKNALKGIIGMLCLLICANINANTYEDSINDKNVSFNTTKLPVTFIKNEGQFNDSILFTTNSNGITIWFTENSVYYQLDHMRLNKFTEIDLKSKEEKGILSALLKVDFLNARSSPEVIGYDKRGFSYNYFLGKDESKWKTDVSSYSYIVYQDIYPGIDLKYYQKDGVLEYEFIVGPGINPEIIRLQYYNADNIQINSIGELTVETHAGIFKEHKPFAYQENIENQIVASFDKSGDNTISFSLASYDDSKTLIIDPFLEFSSYLGGSASDVCNAIVVNDVSQDDITLTGTTSSSNFPIVNAMDNTLSGTQDIFVARIIKDSIVFCTFIGGFKY